MSKQEYRSDRLARLLERRSRLQEEIDNLRAEMVADGHKLQRGRRFDAYLVVVPTKRTDWYAVAKRMEPSHQLVSAHTVRGSRIDVQLVSK